MDKSLFLHRKASNKIPGFLADALAAVLLAVSFFCCLAEQFAFSLKFSDFFQGGISSGLVCAWNHVADVLGSTDYVILKKYEGGGKECGLFLLLTLLLLILAAFFVLRSRFLPALLVFILPPVLTALFFSLSPSTWSAAFFGIGVITAAIVMKHQEGLIPAAAGTLALALVLALVLTIFGTFFKGTLPADSPLLNSVKNLVYGTEDLGYGDLTKRERNVREGEALQVKMSRPDSVYLKGFTGSSFTGTVWKELPNEVCYGEKDMLDAISQEGFSTPGQLAQASVLAFDEKAAGKNEMEIRNTGTDRRLAWVPYEILGEGSLSSALKKGGFRFYAGLFGQFPEYDFTATENQTSRWTDVAARFFTKALNSGMDTEAMEDYLRLESHYNQFVYENFAGLTKSEKLLLAEYIGDPGDQSEGHLGYKTAISRIRQFLEENFIYSEDLGAKRTESRNELQEFLESGKGYDIHFATAATLLFRYFGIPARYVEGYLITPEDAENASEGEWISVSRKRVHAWTEIYIDGIGFVPLEVTPEYYGVMEEADLETGISNEMLQKEFEERYQHEQKEEPDEISLTEPEEPESKFGKVLSAIVLILLALFVLWLLWLAVSGLLKKGRKALRRRKLFLKSDPKTAVAAIYEYMENQNLKPDPEITALGNLAAYSRRSLSEQDRERMLKELKNLKKRRSRG